MNSNALPTISASPPAPSRPLPTSLAESTARSLADLPARVVAWCDRAKTYTQENHLLVLSYVVSGVAIFGLSYSSVRRSNRLYRVYEQTQQLQALKAILSRELGETGPALRATPRPNEQMRDLEQFPGVKLPEHIFEEISAQTSGAQSGREDAAQARSSRNQSSTSDRSPG